MRPQGARSRREGPEKSKERPFPVQDWGYVPWEVGEMAWNAYAARYGKEQSCETIARRGGFGTGEMDEFYPGWKEASDAVVRLKARVERAEALVAEFEKYCTCPARRCLSSGNSPQFPQGVTP